MTVNYIAVNCDDIRYFETIEQVNNFFKYDMDEDEIPRWEVYAVKNISQTLGIPGLGDEVA